MTAGPALSVVVCTRDRPDRLARCLDALARSLRPGDEVVVVDSASADPAPVAAVAAAGGARLLRLPVPGAARARNTGWRAAAAEHVAFVDDDVEVEPGWAAAVAQAFADGAQWVTGWISPLPGQEGLERPVPVMEHPVRADARDLPRAVGAGANHAATRAALVAVGGYREALGPGTWLSAAEDTELFDRLLAAGLPGTYTPAARVGHDMRRDRRAALRTEWRYGKGEGARLLLLARTGPRRWRAQARVDLWDDGVARVVRQLRDGYEYGAAADALRLVGLLVGAVAAVPLRGALARSLVREPA